MPLLQQTGKVFVGPGQEKEAQLIGLGLRKLRSSEKEDLDRAKRYALDQSVKYVMLKQRDAHQQQQQKISLYTQALSIMSRVYIGSINFDIGEEHLRQAFCCYGPIKLVNMCRDPSTGNHKGVHEWQNDGRQKHQSVAGDSAPEHATGPVHHRHDCVRSAQDLRSVFEAFGEITKCQLAKDASGRHRSFGYIEFATPQASKEAVEGMNGFNFGGQCLVIGRSITPPDALNYLSTTPNPASALPAATAMAAAAITAKIQATEVVRIPSL